MFVLRMIEKVVSCLIVFCYQETNPFPHGGEDLAIGSRHPQHSHRRGFRPAVDTNRWHRPTKRRVRHSPHALASAPFSVSWSVPKRPLLHLHLWAEGLRDAPGHAAQRGTQPIGQGRDEAE